MSKFETKRKAFAIGELIGDLEIDFDREPEDLVYFCGDSFYGYYSYEDFDKFIENLNAAWKKAKEFIKNESNS